MTYFITDVLFPSHIYLYGRRSTKLVDIFIKIYNIYNIFQFKQHVIHERFFSHFQINLMLHI